MSRLSGVPAQRDLQVHVLAWAIWLIVGVLTGWALRTTDADHGWGPRMGTTDGLGGQYVAAGLLLVGLPFVLVGGVIAVGMLVISI